MTGRRTPLPWWLDGGGVKKTENKNTLAPFGPVNRGFRLQVAIGPGVRVTGNGLSKSCGFRPGVRVNDLFRNHVREQLMCLGTGIRDIIRL